MVDRETWKDAWEALGEVIYRGCIGLMFMEAVLLFAFAIILGASGSSMDS